MTFLVMPLPGDISHGNGNVVLNKVNCIGNGNSNGEGISSGNSNGKSNDTSKVIAMALALVMALNRNLAKSATAIGGTEV